MGLALKKLDGLAPDIFVRRNIVNYQEKIVPKPFLPNSKRPSVKKKVLRKSLAL